MKKIIALSVFSFLPLIAADLKLDAGGQKIFDTIIALAKTSLRGNFQATAPEVKHLQVEKKVALLDDHYEIIIKGGIPSYLVTPEGYYTKLIGTVWGDLSDVTYAIEEKLDLYEIEEPSALASWIGGRRYAVGVKALTSRLQAKL